MEDETKCGTLEIKCGTYESKTNPYESNSTEQTFAVKKEIGEDLLTVKEEVNEKSLTVKEENEEESLFVKQENEEDSLSLKEKTGEKWFCYATDLLNGSSSADDSGTDVPPHDNLLSDEEKVLRILHAAEVNLKKEDEKSFVEPSTCESHLSKLCVKCGEIFAFDFQLQKHISDAHKGKFEHICEECGREFATVFVLKRHKQVDHRNCNFIFAFEGSDHPDSKSPKAHESDHLADMNSNKTLENPTLEAPNQCTECGKQFAFKIQLRRHVTNVHRDERDLTCEQCGRKFSRITALYAHKKVVHQNRLFMCPFEGCDRPGYKYNQSLNEHIRSVHTHVRPYECKTCGKAFVTKNRLREHNVTHSAENVFHCKCGNTFRCKGTLNRHRRLCLLH